MGSFYIDPRIPKLSDSYSNSVNSNLYAVNKRYENSVYTDRQWERMVAPTQDQSTCYANAIGAAFWYAMKRIEGREGGYPSFESICQQLISEYGYKGASTKAVLEKWCPYYRLRYKEISANDAYQAINALRPVVTTFHLCDSKWTAFSSFYKQNRTGILDSSRFQQDITQSCFNNILENGGHAVVLMNWDSQALTFQNSWGTPFADDGYFKISSVFPDIRVVGEIHNGVWTHVYEPALNYANMRFYDVFWYESDLTENERKYFQLQNFCKTQ